MRLATKTRVWKRIPNLYLYNIRVDCEILIELDTPREYSKKKRKERNEPLNSRINQLPNYNTL